MQTGATVVPTLTLFTSPRACSTACHIALAESGLTYDIELVRIRAREHLAPAYLCINPWAKIPALRIGDEVLTETHAILSYIGDASAGNALLPKSPALARARAHEWMNFLSSTVHIAFRPLTKTQSLTDDPNLHAKLREFGAGNLRKTLLEVDRRLAGRPFALGDRYSVIDPYLLVFWIWSQRDDIAPHVPDLPNWRAQAERVFAREATWPCLRREGITPENIANP